MKRYSTKLATIVFWLALGCSQTEVKNGDKRRSGDRENTAGESQNGDETHSPPPPGTQDAQSVDNHQGDHHDSMHDSGKNDEKGKDGGQDSSTGQSPNPSTDPNPTNSPPPAPEPPLPPSQLGWNGVQLIGTNQIYFLPID